MFYFIMFDVNSSETQSLLCLNLFASCTIGSIKSIAIQIQITQTEQLPTISQETILPIDVRLRKINNSPLTCMCLSALRKMFRFDVFLSSSEGTSFFKISKHSFKCARLDVQIK